MTFAEHLGTDLLSDDRRLANGYWHANSGAKAPQENSF